ncbi:hypothetical protein IFM89_005315 [Coptis chinensis]|uniref:N-acetyltransferase domain-containing protein n=1 Tax=Coptis chinensis TaxID=261450 RepID=A0A835HAQ7_9MAGN|nr:hypothetical protein IFM89_005315 [Coptis chinensis]
MRDFDEGTDAGAQMHNSTLTYRFCSHGSCFTNNKLADGATSKLSGLRVETVLKKNMTPRPKKSKARGVHTGESCRFVLKITPNSKVRHRRTPPSVFISTNPSDVNVGHLTDLFSSANLSCHRFPKLDQNGRVEPVEPEKLRIALSHSSVVVSAFNSPFPSFPFPLPMPMVGLVGECTSNTSGGGQLVGFGRAVSDNGLTASIHDVVVLPSLQGLGIGRRILSRIIRVLCSRGIYDISALCSEKERLFFEACGFGDDILMSTTMMYAKAPFEHNTKGDKNVVPAGRKLLLVPPSREASHLR